MMLVVVPDGGVGRGETVGCGEGVSYEVSDGD